MPKFPILPMVAALALVCAHARATEVDINSLDPAWGSVNGVPVTVDLAAGTYAISYIDSGGLYNGWDNATANFGTPSASPAVGGCDASGANCRYGWTEQFAYAINGNPSTAVVFNGPSGYVGGAAAATYATAALAMGAYVAALGYDTLTLSSASSVTFYAPDTFSTDNWGGVSLAVVNIPEPASAAMLTVGLSATALARRRAKRLR